MKKKVLVSLGIVGGLLLISGGMVYAESLEEALKAYLADPSFDWLGRNFDKILFEQITNVSTGNFNDAELMAKLKFIFEDIKTMPLQLKCIKKIVEQNAPAYATLGGTAGIKIAVGSKNFGELLFKLFKVMCR